MLSIAEQEDWRVVLRVGVLPFATQEALVSLATALREGDPRLLRRRTTEPAYVAGVDLPGAAGECRGSCPLAWLWWRGLPAVQVDEVDRQFVALIERCATATGSPLAARAFLDSWDGWPDVDRGPLPAAELLAEVEHELAVRQAALEGEGDLDDDPEPDVVVEA